MSQDTTGTPKTKTSIVQLALKHHNDDLKEEKAKLEEQLKQKEELLEELKSNSKRKEVIELDRLIAKWREVCQSSLKELHGKSCGSGCGEDNDVPMGQFLDRLGVSKTLVHFDNDEDCFY